MEPYDVAGRHEGGFDFDSETLPGAGGADAVMLAFSADAIAASELWTLRMEGSETDIFDGVAASPSFACAGGFFGGTTDLDGLSLTTAGGLDGVVVCATPEGTRSWHLPFANPGADLVSQVAFGSDFLAITGTFEGSVIIGSTPLLSGGGWDSYIATTSLTGTVGWVRTLSSAGDFPTHVGVDDSDQILLSAITRGAASTGGMTLPSGGESDWTLARWTSDGTLSWARSFGSSGEDEGRCTAVSASGEIWAVGEFQASVDFDGALVSAGDFDGALLRISE